MILISHRGNVTEKNISLENKPSYIQAAIDRGYNVEVDVWFHNKGWWLGHDKPQYKTSLKWINSHGELWVHCKNLDALYQLVSIDYDSMSNAHYFWHQSDDFTLTSRGFIWTYPAKKLTPLSICVLPEIARYKDSDLKKCLGICSDQIENYKYL